jgi:hypothetical protein
MVFATSLFILESSLEVRGLPRALHQWAIRSNPARYGDKAGPPASSHEEINAKIVRVVIEATESGNLHTIDWDSMPIAVKGRSRPLERLETWSHL